MSTDSRASKVYTRTGDKGKTSLIGGSRVSKSELRLDAYGTVDELNAVVGILLHDIHHDFERASEIDPTYDVGEILEPRQEATAAPPSETKISTKPNLHSSADANRKTQLSQFDGTSLNSRQFTQDLHEIQSDLFNIGSQLACEDEIFRSQLPNVTEAKIAELEYRMDEFSQKLAPLKNFILPGGSRSAGMAHLARTVCRRAERICVQLAVHWDEKFSEQKPQMTPPSGSQANAADSAKFTSSKTVIAGVDPLVIRYLNRLSDYFFVLSRFLNASLKIQEPIWRPTSAEKSKQEPKS